MPHGILSLTVEIVDRRGGAVPATRGRRPAGSGTREAILAAASHAFAELGYPRTTLRAVAREAGVDTRLVTHYFGTKQDLFVAVVELPFDPEVVMAAVLGPGPDGVGHRLATFAVGMMETPDARRTMTGLLRAAASEEEAAVRVRDLLVARLLTPLAQHIGADRPDLRAALTGAQMAGLVVGRHIVGLPRLAQATPEELVGAVGPVLQHYLTGDLSPESA
jgi:AcrR family transcriptional regulator